MEIKRRDSLELIEKEKEIKFLQEEVNRITNKKRNIAFQEVAQEIKINYPEVVKLSYADVISTNFERIDTIPNFNVNWSVQLSDQELRTNQKKLQDWLAFKLKRNQVKVTILTD